MFAPAGIPEEVPALAPLRRRPILVPTSSRNTPDQTRLDPTRRRELNACRRTRVYCTAYTALAREQPSQSHNDT